MPKIHYCMALLNRIDEVQKAVRLVSPRVDRTVIIDGGSTDGGVEWLRSDETKDWNVEVQVHPWVDDPPGQRNKYLDAVPRGDWILVTDSDEYLDRGGVWALRQLVEEAEKDRVVGIQFQAHDIQYSLATGGSVWQNLANHWNLMLFKRLPSVRYVGHTHVTLGGLVGKVRQAPHRYYHIKSMEDQWLRGGRNYWTTAQPARNIHTPQWREFRNLCAENGLHYFYELFYRMRDGTVPERVAQWFWDNREDDNAEVRSFFVCYFVFMHPELNPQLSNRDYPYQPDRIPVTGMRF